MSERIAVALVGSGGMARQHAQAYQRIDDARIVGFCDVKLERAQALAAEYGGEAFSDPAEMLETLKPDGAYVLLPPFAHGEAEFACLEQKTPFFVEKPINLDLAQAEEIARRVQESRLLTAAGYLNRYRTGVQQAREMLAEDPAVLSLGGWIGERPEVNPEEPISIWWVDKSKSGGQFIEQVTHTVDLVRFLMGEATEVRACAADGFIQGIPGYNIEDAWAVAIKFASGGVANLWACCASNARSSVTLDVYAQDCAFEFRGWHHDCNIFRTGQEEPEAIPRDDDCFYLEDVAFVDMLRSGEQSNVQSDYADGLESLRITIAADQSVATGQRIAL